jgi:hypothetical protein
VGGALLPELGRWYSITSSACASSTARSSADDGSRLTALTGLLLLLLLLLPGVLLPLPVTATTWL